MGRISLWRILGGAFKAALQFFECKILYLLSAEFPILSAEFLFFKCTEFPFSGHGISERSLVTGSIALKYRTCQE